MRTSRKLAALAVISLLSGCASIDAQDRFVLGEASRANIAAQSERSVDLPNSKKVESVSGVRAVATVKALNDGQTKQLAKNDTGAED